MTADPVTRAAMRRLSETAADVMTAGIRTATREHAGRIERAIARYGNRISLVMQLDTNQVTAYLTTPAGNTLELFSLDAGSNELERRTA